MLQEHSKESNANRRLGVGITYFSGIEPLLQAARGLVDVLEVEPLTIWRHRRSGTSAYVLDQEAFDRLNSFGLPKLLHGVGFPVGGSRSAGPEHILPLLEMVKTLGASMASEHLSFNRAECPRGEFETGFLLPPRQTMEGARAAARSIRSVADRLGVPFVFEPGVNYLLPRSDELPDGEFVAWVLKYSGCGLLLDVHNVWANEKNGRQTVGEFLAQVPLERVIEVNVAAGAGFEGHSLDAHSGIIPETLIQVLRETLPRLPNLRVINFELSPENLETFGLENVKAQLKALRRIWEPGGEEKERELPSIWAPFGESDGGRCEGIPGPAEWEDTLGALATGQHVRGRLADELAMDQGLDIIKELLNRFRLAIATNSLELSRRYLILVDGKEKLSELLAEYWKRSTPEPFASDEALGLADYLRGLRLDIPYLDGVLEFETAAIRARCDGTPNAVKFGYNPLPVLRALAANETPRDAPPGNYEIEVTSCGRTSGLLLCRRATQSIPNAGS